MPNSSKKVSKRARYFDWFIMAGLLMNVLIVTLLVGLWVYKSFIA